MGPADGDAGAEAAAEAVIRGALDASKAATEDALEASDGMEQAQPEAAAAETAEERAKRIASQWIKSDTGAGATEVCPRLLNQTCSTQQAHPASAYFCAQEAPTEAAGPPLVDVPQDALPEGPAAPGSTPSSVRGKLHSMCTSHPADGAVATTTQHRIAPLSGCAGLLASWLARLLAYVRGGAPSAQPSDAQKVKDEYWSHHTRLTDLERRQADVRQQLGMDFGPSGAFLPLHNRWAAAHMGYNMRCCANVIDTQVCCACAGASRRT